MLAKNPNLFEYVCFNKMGQLDIIHVCHNNIKHLDLKLEVVAFSIDENHFVIATYNQLLIYRLKDYKMTSSYNSDKQITSISIYNEYLLLGTDCGTVIITNIETNEFFPIKETYNKIILSD